MQKNYRIITFLFLRLQNLFVFSNGLGEEEMHLLLSCSSYFLARFGDKKYYGETQVSNDGRRKENVMLFY